MLWSIIVGGFIGFLAGAITNKGGAMGVIAKVVAGLIGSSVGQSLFGTWGPSLAGMSLIPSVLGAVIVVAVQLSVTVSSVLSSNLIFIMFLFLLKIILYNLI